MSASGEASIHQDLPGVGARVRKLRLKRMLSQRALAQAAGVHRSVISKLESGEIQHTTWLPQLAAALCTSALFLATGEDGENPSSHSATPAPKLKPAELAKHQELPHGGVVFVQVITIGPDGKTPELKREYMSMAPQFLPAGAQDSSAVCIATVGHSSHVVAMLDTPLTDGMHSLIAWRGAMVNCRIYFTGLGYRLERKGAIDELSAKDFREQVFLVGRVLAVVSIDQQL